MLTYILLVLAALIIGMLLYANSRPDTVHYERSAVINAAPDRILAQITDFRNWQPWSPWEKLDPAMKRTYSGADRGVGAQYHWSGNKKAGEGRMTISAVAPNNVKIDLYFIKPWEAHCITNFSTAPEGQATRLTWTMDGPNTFMGKLFGLFANMDKMIGKDFENGLRDLKALAERA